MQISAGKMLSCLNWHFFESKKWDTFHLYVLLHSIYCVNCLFTPIAYFSTGIIIFSHWFVRGPFTLGISIKSFSYIPKNILFTHSSIDRPLGYFHFLALVNNTAVKLVYKFLCGHMSLILLCIYLEVDLLGHVVSLSLCNFEELPTFP